MTTLTKMIYIASPYSPKGVHKIFHKVIKYFRYLKITKVIARLQDEYPYAFIGPITQSHHTAKYMKCKCSLFKSWQKRDLTYISHCDEVWVMKMKDWDKSTGVKAEIKFAIKNNIPVRYLEEDDIK